MYSKWLYSIFIKSARLKAWPSPSSNFHSSNILLIEWSNKLYKKYKFENPFEEELKRRAKKVSPTIMLIDTSGEILVETLAKAADMAIKRNLKLVKIEHPQERTEPNRQVYQLMDTKQFHEESMKLREKKLKQPSVGFKGEKLINISSKIENHDLEIKMRQINEWIRNNYQVKVTVTNPTNANRELPESVVSKVEVSVKECGGRVLQKIATQSGGMKFFINPPKSNKEMLSSQTAEGEVSTEEKS